jgi:hypothetical protein
MDQGARAAETDRFHKLRKIKETAARRLLYFQRSDIDLMLGPQDAAAEIYEDSSLRRMST